MDFGSLVRLYSLLDAKDRELIGHALGLKKACAATLHVWLRSLNILRNHCAHNNRVWNRTFPYPPPKPSLVVIESKLHHINNIGEESRQKLYHLAAIIAYLIVRVDPATNWPLRFRTELKKFRPVNGMTPENTMGFPEGWSDMDLWKYDPKVALRTASRASQGLAS
jgi:abortive infection bacteriophage resistance protein